MTIEPVFLCSGLLLALGLILPFTSCSPAYLHPSSQNGWRHGFRRHLGQKSRVGWRKGRLAWLAQEQKDLWYCFVCVSGWLGLWMYGHLL